MIRLGDPALETADIDALVDVLRTGHLVQGAEVERFETLIAARTGVKHAVAVSSGTAALHLMLLAAGVGADDEVIVPDFSFPATANAVELAGGRAVLADIVPETFNIDVASAARLVTRKTRAIMPVHAFGQPCDMDALESFARDRGLLLLEDAACAIGSAWRGRPAGGFGNAAALSFHPRKIVTTGEGGAVTTNDDALASAVRQLRNHGQRVVDGRISFRAAGFNYRLTNFQAALGSKQMERLDATLARRRALAGLYRARLAADARIVLPAVAEGAETNWQAFVVRVARRDDVRARMNELGVESGMGTWAIGLQPAYAGRPDAAPASAEAFRASLALPLHAALTDEEAITVSDALLRAVAELAG